MDYDRSDIPTVYDEARTLTPQGLRLWLDLLSAHIDRGTIPLILDLGCGTGRFSEPLAVHLGARVIAIDPSQKMLNQARGNLGSADITWLRASAEALPLHDGSVDLVFMSMQTNQFNPNDRELRKGEERF
jgi:ubiquinone/menaquinone biosynthesis C-methylase UbiE